MLAITASAKPQKQAATRSSSGSSRSSPWTSSSPSQNAAKKWDEATPGAKVIFAQGKSATDDAGEIAAIQNMVAQGVKGIAITPTSPAVSAALDKAIKQGVKVVLMDNDIPAWKNKTSVVATDNYKGGVLAGKFLATKLKAGDTLGILEGVPGVPALDARVDGHARRARRAEEPDQGRLEARDRLRPDEGCGRRPDDADREQEPDRDLRRLWPARARRDPVDQERRDQARRDHPRRVRRALRTRWRRSRPGTRPAASRSSRRRSARSGSPRSTTPCTGKKVPKNVDTGTAFVTKANAEQVRLGRHTACSSDGHGGLGGCASAHVGGLGAATTMIVDAHHHFWNLDAGSRSPG